MDGFAEIQDKILDKHLYENDIIKYSKYITNNISENDLIIYYTDALDALISFDYLKDRINTDKIIQYLEETIIFKDDYKINSDVEMDEDDDFDDI